MFQKCSFFFIYQQAAFAACLNDYTINFSYGQ